MTSKEYTHCSVRIRVWSSFRNNRIWTGIIYHCSYQFRLWNIFVELCDCIKESVSFCSRRRSPGISCACCQSNPNCVNCPVQSNPARQQQQPNPARQQITIRHNYFSALPCTLFFCSTFLTQLRAFVTSAYSYFINLRSMRRPATAPN